MTPSGLDPNTPLMSLQQIKSCGHLLLGTLQLRCASHGVGDDPRKEVISARVFVKRRLREIPETTDKNERNYVLRAIYKIIDTHYAAIFAKIGQVSGELAFLSSIQATSDFPSIELQFIWTCDYLFTSGQLEERWRGDFHVPNTPDFEMPVVGDEEQEERFAIESEKELRRQLENYLAMENIDLEGLELLREEHRQAAIASNQGAAKVEELPDDYSAPKEEKKN